jgi:hypothetical protein
MYEDEDFMEYGKGLRNLPNGWSVETMTGNLVDPEGNVFDTDGELIWTASIVDPDDEYNR